MRANQSKVLRLSKVLKGTQLLIPGVPGLLSIVLSRNVLRRILTGLPEESWPYQLPIVLKLELNSSGLRYNGNYSKVSGDGRLSSAEQETSPNLTEELCIGNWHWASWCSWR